MRARRAGRIVVVTDSSACLPDEDLRHPQLRVLPISIVAGEVQGEDGTIDPLLVYRALERDELVRSRPPTVLDYLTAVEAEEFAGAVVITPAREFTVMHRNATFAARLTNRPVKVIDTRTAAAAQGLVVRAALAVATAGGGLVKVASAAQKAAAQAELVATLPTVRWIARSGRMGEARIDGTPGADADGPALFRFRRGAVLPLGTIAGAADLPAALGHAWSDRAGADAAEALVFHAAAPEEARRVRAALGARQAIVEFSPAMAMYTGPGCVGIAWLRPSRRARRGRAR